jgi:hypothetical protein
VAAARYANPAVTASPDFMYSRSAPCHERPAAAA